MEVLIKRNIKKKLQSGSNMFHFNVQMERNIAEKTALIKKKSLCFISVSYLKKLHNFKVVSHLNYSPRRDSKQYAFGFLLTSLKITLFEYFTLLKCLTCFIIMHYEVFLSKIIMSNI